VFVTALKIMTVCFEGDLVADWPRVARTIRDLGKCHDAGSMWWSFIDFVVSQRIPLFVLLQPFILYKVCSSSFLSMCNVTSIPDSPHGPNFFNGCPFRASDKLRKFKLMMLIATLE
jgi:hypothetical protein